MTEAIVVAIITGGLALLGTIYSSNKTCLLYTSDAADD